MLNEQEVLTMKNRLIKAYDEASVRKALAFAKLLITAQIRVLNLVLELPMEDGVKA